MEKLANINLKRLFQSENHSLHRSGFVDEEGHPLSNPNELISLLEDEHLIETEKDPDVFFLTEYALNILEKGEWSTTKEHTSEKLPGNDPLTLSNFRETLEKASKDTNRKKVYPIIWFALIGIGGLMVLNYLIEKDEIKQKTLPTQEQVISKDSNSVKQNQQEIRVDSIK